MLHAGQSIGVEAVAADCRRVAPAAAVRGKGTHECVYC